MMIKEYRHLIKLQRFLMEQKYLQCVRMKCCQKMNGALIKSWQLKQEYQSDNAGKMIVSQGFGGDKYSKNIRVTMPIRQLCHKTLERISTAKLTMPIQIR